MVKPEGLVMSQLVRIALELEAVNRGTHDREFKWSAAVLIQRLAVG